MGLSELLQLAMEHSSPLKILMTINLILIQSVHNVSAYHSLYQVYNHYYSIQQMLYINTDTEQAKLLYRIELFLWFFDGNPVPTPGMVL